MAPAGVLRPARPRTRHVWRVVAFALIVLALPSPARPQESEDTLLRAAAGPYRGRVLDAQTGQPIPDAVVVILWQRLDDEIAGLRRLVTALETFTNSDGEFVHDVRAVEAKLPPRTLAPRLLMFRPGYTPVPDRPQVRPPGVAAARFAARGRDRHDDRGHGSRRPQRGLQHLCRHAQCRAAVPRDPAAGHRRAAPVRAADPGGAPSPRPLARWPMSRWVRAVVAGMGVLVHLRVRVGANAGGVGSPAGAQPRTAVSRTDPRFGHEGAARGSGGRGDVGARSRVSLPGQHRALRGSRDGDRRRGPVRDGGEGHRGGGAPTDPEAGVSGVSCPATVRFRIGIRHPRDSWRSSSKELGRPSSSRV